MCVDILNKTHDCHMFLKEHGHKEFIICYKIVDYRGNDFVGVYNQYYSYRPGWNQAMHRPISTDRSVEIPVKVTDNYHPFRPTGIHVYFDSAVAMSLEGLPLNYCPDDKGIFQGKCGYKLIKVKCYLKDFMLCDKLQAAFTRVWIDPDQLTAPW